jgi:hypothetical protein
MWLESHFRGPQFDLGDATEFTILAFALLLSGSVLLQFPILVGLSLLRVYVAGFVWFVCADAIGYYLWRTFLHISATDAVQLALICFVVAAAGLVFMLRSAQIKARVLATRQTVDGSGKKSLGD